MLYLLYSRPEHNDVVDYTTNPKPCGAVRDLKEAKAFVEQAQESEHRYFIEGGYRQC